MAVYLPNRESSRKALRKQQLILKALIIISGLIAFGFVISLLAFAWFAKDLPSPGKLSQNTGSSTVFLDREGKVLFDMYKDKNRFPVKFADIGKDLKNATIAIEDKTFYKHQGISQAGIIRAFLNIIFKRRLEGGSTITQQLIKNSLLTSSRTATRKIKEIILAVAVEKKYTKDQILEMYLNDAPYGGTLYGVGSAAKGYFDKDPKDLTLLESAILAGLPQNPSYYSPFIGSDDAWRGRAQDVLRRMREDKYITSDQEKAALAKLKNYKFSQPHLAINAPHFVFYVRDQLEKEYGAKILDQGVKIKTTLSLDVQKTVEKVLKDEIGKLKNINVGNGAVVVLDSQTGDILAMAGSYDFNDEKFGKFNASLGLRQPGSTLKPVTYALGFEKGYTPATVIMDVKTSFPDQGDKDYSPVNYDGKFRGPVQVRFALGNSLNVPAVKMLAMVGLEDFLKKCSMMGLDTLKPTADNLKRFGLSVTLGGGEVTLLDLTRAYSVFARGGIAKETRYLDTLTDFNGRKIGEQKEDKGSRVWSDEISFIVSHILSDNNARIEEFGPNSYLNVPGKTVSVKTGTTDDKRDNWTVGYTKSVTVGVWVGNNDNSKMDPKIASGATGASPIWHNIMVQLLKKYDDGIIDKPAKVKALGIDASLGGLPKDANPTRSEYFIEGTEPKDISPFYKKLKISKNTGKLANDVEIKSGKYDEKDFIVFTENDPVSTDGKNRWQEGINAWANEQKDDRYKPPTETSSANSEDVIVSIKSPDEHSQLDNTRINIKAKIVSMTDIKNVKVFINGSERFNYNENKHDVDEYLDLSEGVYELKIQATNTKDKTSDATIKFGVKKPWDWTAPTPAPTSSPTPSATAAP